MNMSYIQTVFDETIKTVSVVFDLEDAVMARHYTYKTRLDLKVGDVCAVATPHGLNLVEVVEVHEDPRINPDDRIEYKWITNKVDVESIKAAEQADIDFADKARTHARSKARERAKEELEEFRGLFLEEGEKAPDDENEML